jgi:hypothetical protein
MNICKQVIRKVNQQEWCFGLIIEVNKKFRRPNLLPDGEIMNYAL